MSDVQLNDIGHENSLIGGELIAASAIAQFYIFANRCMDWAHTTRSLKERSVYTQMAMQWLYAPYPPYLSPTRALLPAPGALCFRH